MNESSKIAQRFWELAKVNLKSWRFNLACQVKQKILTLPNFGDVWSA